MLLVQFLLLELTDLSERAPSRVAGVSVAEIVVCERGKTAAPIEARPDLVGERLVLEESMPARDY